MQILRFQRILTMEKCSWKYPIQTTPMYFGHWLLSRANVPAEINCFRKAICGSDQLIVCVCRLRSGECLVVQTSCSSFSGLLHCQNSHYQVLQSCEIAAYLTLVRSLVSISSIGVLQVEQKGRSEWDAVGRSSLMIYLRSVCGCCVCCIFFKTLNWGQSHVWDL